MPSKPVQRFTFIAVWIAFYFMLIDTTSSLFLYGTFLVLWIPSILLLFAGLSIVLGPATDHFCRTFFNWYTTRSPEVFVNLIVTLIILGSVMYSNWQVMMPPTHFEKLTINSVNAVNLTRVVVVVQNTGNSEATITNIFVEGVNVTSEPATPILLDVGSSKTVTLALDSPLASTKNFSLIIKTASGNEYPKWMYATEASAETVGGQTFLWITVNGPAKDMMIVVTDNEGRNFGNISFSKGTFRNGSATVRFEVPSNLVLRDEPYYFTFFDSNGNEFYQTTWGYESKLNTPTSMFDKELDVEQWSVAKGLKEIDVKFKALKSDTVIKEILIYGEPLSTRNGTSDPRLPIATKVGTTETVRLTFSTPLTPNIYYTIEIVTERGYVYLTWANTQS